MVYAHGGNTQGSSIQAEVCEFGDLANHGGAFRQHFTEV